MIPEPHPSAAHQDAASVPTEGRTLADVLDGFAEAGYPSSFTAVSGGVRCGGFGHRHPVTEISVDAVERFEGVSDPDDEAIVVALTCPACGTRGALVAAFGPSAGPEEAELLRALPAPPDGFEGRPIDER